MSPGSAPVAFLAAFLARVFLRYDAAFGPAVQVLKAGLDGLWLGAAWPALLYAIDERYYAGRDDYVSADYTRSGLKDWEATAVRSWFPASGRLVVTSAGGGREVVGLVGLGYAVTAYEVNADMVAHGQAVLAEAAPGATLAVSARDRWPAGVTGPVDGVVIGWGSYNHVGPRAARVALLRDARAVVPVGAPVLLSFYLRGANDRYFRVVHAVGSAVRRLTGRPPLDLGDALTPFFAHHFTRAEVLDDLRRAGWELVDFQERPYAHAVGRAV